MRFSRWWTIPREKQLKREEEKLFDVCCVNRIQHGKVKSPPKKSAIGNLVRSQQIIESLPALDLTRKSAIGNWPETHAMQINCELLLEIFLTNNLQFKTFAFSWWFVVVPSSSPFVLIFRLIAEWIIDFRWFSGCSMYSEVAESTARFVQHVV